MTGRRCVIAGVAALLAGSVSGFGQTPAQSVQAPSFQSRVTFVEVDAIVTDQQGRFVRDLKKEDFQVSEDGKRQNLDTFSLIDIPVQAGSSLSVAIQPDVVTNAQPFEGRVYVLVLDTLHTERTHTQQARSAARDFVERNLGPQDLMAVVHLGGLQRAGQDFTANKRLLFASIDQFQGNRLKSAAVVRQENEEAGTVLAPNGQKVNLFKDFDVETERANNAMLMLRELRAAADWFSGVRGRRKAMVMFSEGVDYDFENLFDQKFASTVIEGAREAVAAITRANVSIYPIDPSGLSSSSPHDIEQSTSLQIPLQNERRLARNSLHYLADSTGGFALVDSNGFKTAFDRIVNENSSYYMLAYYPGAEKATNAFHNIQVKVDRPGLVVRARKGYASTTAPAVSSTASPVSGTSRELVEVMRSPMPISGLTIDLFAAPFKSASADGSVLLGIELRGRDLKMVPEESVEVAYAALDNDSKIRASQTMTFKLNLQPEVLARGEQTGLRLFRRLTLPPGRYQLRVGARETEGGRSGSVVTDLEVPDFTKAPLAMSGLLLTSPTGARMPTVARDERIIGVLPAPPVGLRTFPQSDEVALLVELYDSNAAPHSVEISTIVASPDGSVALESREKPFSEEFGAERTYRHQARVPMSELNPGSYVLTVQARSSLDPGTVVSRQTAFKVVAAAAPPTR